MPRWKFEAEQQGRAFVQAEAEDEDTAYEIALEKIEEGDSDVEYQDDASWLIVGTPSLVEED